MTLANPIFLWSLLGLSVPIAIHLLSRKEGQVIRIGSIRHIRETNTQQFKGVRLNEILLLVLRSMMIFIFSLLLSGLQCSSGDRKWVVVEKGLEAQPSVKKIVDSLKSNGFEFHWLANDFPVTSPDISLSLNYWKLVEDLKVANLSSALVFATSRFENFNGERVALDSCINWISMSMDEIDVPLIRVNVNKDSALVRTGHFNSKETFFTSEKVRSSSIGSRPDTISIAVISEAAYAHDKKIIAAALNAIANEFPIRLNIVDSNPLPTDKNIDWYIWLSQAKPPSHDSARVIFMHPSNGTELFVRSKASEWALTKRLNAGVAIDENLTLRLAELIVPSGKLKALAHKNDRRMMPDSLAWSSINEVQSTQVSSSIDSWLVIFLMVLLLAERIIAYRKMQ